MDKEIFYLMRVYCTVVELRSFSAAADELGVQAPAISKAIAKLESMLGKRLLNRSTRSVEMSEVGSYFYKQAIEHLTTLNSTLEVVESWNSAVKGSLKVTATPAVGEGFISKVIAEFHQSYPYVAIELLFTNEIIKLPSQNIDIAIRSSNKLENSCLRSKQLISAKRMVLASPSYIEKHGVLNNVDDISRHQCLNFKHKKVLNLWPYFIKNQQFEVITNDTLVCNNYASLRDMCIQGVGIARLFQYQVMDELANGKLIQLLPKTNWGEQTIHAIYHEKMADAPKVKAFVDLLQNI
ncbi:MAG: LysR family transcriptional regulator [Colwellia sp.]|nr:LysR family transcriptional regulator [Colwellia sp.]